MAEAGSFKAACVQLRSGIDRAENVRVATDLINKAASQGAAFIATPEMTNVVDRNAKRMLASLPYEKQLTEIAEFADTARDAKVWLLIGSLAVKADERRAFNRSYLFAPDGTIAARYDKLHMFDVDLPNGESWKESNVYEAGDRAVAVETPLTTIGMTVCYDVRFPSLYRRLAQHGAIVQCVPAAFTAQTGRVHWKTLLTARAIETGSFIVAPAQGGHHEDGRDTYGHSMMIGPWGDVLANKKDDEPGIVMADIEPEQALVARQRIPNLGLEQKFEISIVKQ